MAQHTISQLISTYALRYFRKINFIFSGRLNLEQSTYFTSSRGLLKSCSCHNINPISSRAKIDSNLLNKHEPGGSIYICSDAIENFSNNFLETIKNPFILVTGDSDLAVDDAFISRPFVKKIINNPLLLKWFAQNATSKISKIIPMPIGMDYHTMWEHPGIWGPERTAAVAQEQALINALRNSQGFNERSPHCYSNFHFQASRGDREECLSRISKNICFFEDRPIARISTWQRQSNFKFVLSPEGKGMDCHRTWEAILLGCIPIVKRSQFTSIYEGLPVAIVEDWNMVNEKYISNFSESVSNRKFDFNLIFLNFWKAMLEGEEPKRIPLMNLCEFKKFICNITS